MNLPGLSGSQLSPGLQSDDFGLHAVYQGIAESAISQYLVALHRNQHRLRHTLLQVQMHAIELLRYFCRRFSCIGAPAVRSHLTLLASTPAPRSLSHVRRDIALNSRDINVARGGRCS